jgi:sec-independent protein translocase protein TatB
LFDIGWSELFVIGVVALVVIGPKDLPKVLKTVGIWVRKARTVSREFQSSVEQMVREAELEDVRKEIQKATSIDFEKEIQSTVDPKGELSEAFKPPPETPSLDVPVESHAAAEPHVAAAAEPTLPAPEPAAPEPAAPAESVPQEPHPPAKSGAPG